MSCVSNSKAYVDGVVSAVGNVWNERRNSIRAEFVKAEF
jgi:hypothetical protein